MAPRELAPTLQSLPPILHMKDQNPISGYSKGARGLSVQSRVSGIFTAATVSPSSCRRQQSSRYTIRAGRNLPDKEFRSSSPHVAMRLGPYLHLDSEVAGVWPLRIPDCGFPTFGPFLLIVRTGRIFTAYAVLAVAPDSRGSQHMASFTSQDHSCEGQARGTSRASTLGPFVHCYSRRGRRGLGHFCRALHVAVKTGLYHRNSGELRLAYSL